MRRFAIIEDDKNFAQLVDWTLPDATVTRYAEVSQFVDLKFDAVFCDLRLKETYGHDTILALRAKTESPIIILTGAGLPYLAASDMVAFMRDGADELFAKDIVRDPTFPDLIEKVIARCAEAKR